MLNGSLVALVTPMSTDNEIDWEALECLIDFHLANGTHGMVISGTTGESSALLCDELKQLIQHTVARIKGRIPVIVGTGCASTAKSIEMTRLAKQLKADAALVITPYYVKPTQEGLFQHFNAIARSVAIPQILYNVPGRTGVDMLPETVNRLANEGNIIAIKEATGSIKRAKEVIEICSDRIDILSGDDATAIELILSGGRGVISVTANVAPRLFSQACEHALSGERGEAIAINDKLMPLHEALFVESNPIPVKSALCEMGLISQGIRLPMTPLSESAKNIVVMALKKAAILV